MSVYGHEICDIVVSKQSIVQLRVYTVKLLCCQKFAVRSPSFVGEKTKFLH